MLLPLLIQSHKVKDSSSKLQAELKYMSLSDLDRRCTTLFFCYAACNTFLGSVLGGAFFQQIGTLAKHPCEFHHPTVLGVQLGTLKPSALTSCCCEMQPNG